MPAFGSARSCGASWGSAKPALLLALWLMAGAVGCDRGDDDAIDRRMSAHHAELVAHEVAGQVIFDAKEWILLHPDSERQHHARQQLLRLQEMESQMPGEHRQRSEEDLERQINHLHRYRDIARHPHQERR